MGSWMSALEARAPRNVLIVAMANKLSRIAWAVLSTGEDYRASEPNCRVSKRGKDASGLESAHALPTFPL